MLLSVLVLAVVFVGLLWVIRRPRAYSVLLDSCFNMIQRNESTRRLEPLNDPIFPFGNISQWVHNPGDMLKRASKNYEEYGWYYSWTLFTQTVSVGKVEYIKQMCSQNFTIRSSTRDLHVRFPVWTMLFGEGLFMVGSDKWKRMHKIAIRGMGSNKLRFYLPAVLECSDRVISHLQDSAKEAEKKNKSEFLVDTEELFRNYATEAIMSIGFGQSLAYNEISRLGKKFVNVMEKGSTPIYMVNAYIFSPLPGPTSLRRDIGELHSTCRQIVREYRHAKKKEPSTEPQAIGCLLQALCDASDGDDMFTEEECVHNVYSFIGAGIDTTSTALTHCALLLSLYPEIQDKIRTELKEDEGKFDISKALTGYPYLSAFIKETLRLYPPIIGLPIRKTTTKTKLGQLTLRSGACVSCNSLAVGRAKTVWGEDASVFRPSRFLETSEGRTRDKKGIDITNSMGSKFVTFGAGVRTCIGKNLSVMEVKSVLSKLLRNFEIINLHKDKLNKGRKHWKMNAAFCRVKPEFARLAFRPI
ncbi:hypothetical protein AAMO2058_001106900 [Amorphochlora amoebiformis]